MVTPTGRTLYKKKEGILTISRDQATLTWTPLPGDGPPVVSLLIANVTNLQQTPVSNPKVLLRVFERPQAGDGEATAYSFSFSSPIDARSEADAIKALLSRLLTEIRSRDLGLPGAAAQPTNGNGSGSGSAAMSFASSAISKPASSRWYDDNQLKADTDLQVSLMKKDRNLHQTYMNALQSKPESMSDHAFMVQFWSTRTNLLRAYAIEVSQKKGAYNVLSIVKPRTVDGELKLNISVEQVQMIFAQHPLVKRIYNEQVPGLSEADFWSRFFLSKLSKKLRGDAVSENDKYDDIFDKYNETDDSVFSSKIMAVQVPHTIDLEGNEENQGGFKGGNRKDSHMRPKSDIPVVKTLNSLSEKIMANVAPSDPDRATATEVDEADTYRELALKDLHDDARIDRIILNVKEQSQFFSNQNSAQSADSQLYAKQIPSEVLRAIHRDFGSLQEDGAGGIDLHTSIGIDEDSDSDEESQRRAHVGSRSARRAAQEQILSGLKQRRAELYGQGWDAASPMGLPADITQKALITNATTGEFLKQFWNAFLSGDPDRAQELGYHVESLRKSMSRIEAIAEEAEQAREKTIAQRKEEIVLHFNRTRKKIKWRSEMVGGGKKGVRILLEPTIASLKTAQNLYQAALSEENIKASTEE